jgi:PAS domain S-box-containing protein
MAGRSVLFVDDDPFFLAAVGDFLEEQGYRVRRAADGLEALKAVREEVPDVILLDLIMPRIDGGRVCRYLREDPRFQEIPIVVFSALAARDIVRLPGVSADAYVAKGPLQIVTKNILAAFEHLEAHGRSLPAEEAVFGYEGFRPRRLVSELLTMKRDFDQLLQTMSEGVLKADEADRIFYVNPPALAMLGKEERELIGTDLFDAFGTTCREHIRQTVEGLRGDPSTGKQEHFFSVRGKRFKANFAPLWEEGTYLGLLLILEDVSQLSQPQCS